MALRTFNSNGNTLTSVTGSNTTTYAWDFENRLNSVTLPGTGGTVSFKYDPFGRRIYKSSSSATSVFAYDGDNLAEETNSTGAVVARYEQTQNIDEPLAMLRSGATSYYHADGLGSISSLSNSAGSIANTYTYDSFGKLTASTGSLINPLRYTARESDTETGLYFYRARYYDPATGRFLSADPLGFFAGINFYSYAKSSPTRFIDPRGTDIQEIFNDIYNVGLAFAINARILANVSLSGAEQWVRDQGLPASALHNGAGDAFRHCLWSCLMARNIGARNAALIADEHENAGRREGQPSDEEAMDRANNVVGRVCAAKSPKPCREACTDAYNNGFLFGLGGVRNYFPSN